MQSNASTKVIVGMSGGVDSSVSAYLLLQQGYQVEGLFMKNWEEDDTAEYCSATADLADAKQVCDKLGIKLHTVNFASEYWDNVFEHFLAETKAGRTPNPDVICNREIKFKAFLQFAQHLGADLIATGHYVRSDNHANQSRLLRGLDANKDQSYFLYLLNQYQLSHALFPVGELDKTEVRLIAEQQEFDVFNKKDSTGICFIGERKFSDFLQKFIPAQVGEIQSLEGLTLGSHKGLMYYTIGQRQGLGIGGTQLGNDEPWYVVDKNLSTNTLLVTQGHNHPALFYDKCTITDLHWIGNDNVDFPLTCTSKIRYRQADQQCTIQAFHDGVAIVHFENPQRAITSGQAMVFYCEENCLGGGTIQRAFNE